jgi:two-component system, OmpR family, heavy metal sensor histidine kinase CusS
MMRSVQGRMLAMVGGTALLLIVFGLVIYAALRTALIDEFDASLISAVRLLAASVEWEDEKIELGVDLEEIPEFQGKGAEGYYEFWGMDGRLSAKSPSLGTQDLPNLQGPLDEPVVRAFDLRPGLPVRSASLTFRSKPGEKEEVAALPVTVVVAQDSHLLLGRLQRLLRLLAIATAGTIGLSLVVGTLIVRRTLRPLKVLAADIAAIREDNLTARIETADMPTEMVPVKHRLNDLLDRLEASFKRERRFSADMAHELRTPLAGLRSTVEVTLARPRDEQEYRSSLKECLEITRAMESLVNTLLRLARTDFDPTLFRRERITLVDLANTCWQLCSNKASQRGLTFESTLPVDLTCTSDPDGLRLVFSNLFDNAVDYTEDGGRIDVTGHRTDNTVEIRIANTGCQLSSEQVDQVFDAFWRADASRTDTGVHFGLGLSLVRRTVLALGGTVTAEVDPSGVFAVRLVLPAC